MLNLKAATSKRWKEIEKRPIKRKTISTDMSRNTNKRFQKLLLKDAKKLRKLRDEQGDDQPEEDEQEEQQGNEEGGKWNTVEDDDGLASGEEFGSGDEEINSDEC